VANGLQEMIMKTKQLNLNYHDAAVAILMLGMLLGLYLKSAF
jgi:hypothetical protein